MACSADTRSTSSSRLWTHPASRRPSIASPVVTGDTVVCVGYGFDSTAPFAEVLTRSDKGRPMAES